MTGGFTRSRARVLAALLGAVGVVALAGCETVTTTTTAPVAPLSSASPGPVIDLQLRGVLEVSTAGGGQCPDPAPSTPAPAESASLCSADRTLVYSLGPAAVTGAHVTGLEVTTQAGGPAVQITFDVLGGAALSRVTAAASVASPPRSQLAIVSHGRVQSAPAVTEQIDGRILIISGFADTLAAQSAVALLAG